MINTTLSRILMAFAMVMLAYGAYVAYGDGRLGMTSLLALGAAAAAIPVFMYSGK